MNKKEVIFLTFLLFFPLIVVTLNLFVITIVLRNNMIIIGSLTIVGAIIFVSQWFYNSTLNKIGIATKPFNFKKELIETILSILIVSIIVIFGVYLYEK